MSGDDDCITFDDCVNLDFEWLKNELKLLTRAQRVHILNDYDRKVKEHGVGINEYQKFVMLFDELKETE